jgi:hypothetical protein
VDDENETRAGETVAYDQMIERLTRDLRPVARVWPLGRQVALWAAFATVFVGAVVATTPRPDLAVHLAAPAALFEVAVLGLVLVGLGLLAVRSAVPGGEPVGRTWLVVGLGVALVGALAAFGAPAPAVPLGAFITRGLPCARTTLALAAIPALPLLIVIGRGFPLAPAASGLVAGLAGAVTAVVAMRLHCPLDDAAHQLAWHDAAILPLALISAVVAPAWRRWSELA